MFIGFVANAYAGYSAPAPILDAPASYELPAAPIEEYGPPPAPVVEYGPPPAPVVEYGPPPAPVVEYGPPPAPVLEYGPPKRVLNIAIPPLQIQRPVLRVRTTLLPLAIPSTSYGVPIAPLRLKVRKSIRISAPAPVYTIPSTSYGVPVAPSTRYGL